jgi:zinc finger-like protein
VQELPCGHFMHSHCFAQYTRYNYTCPVCSKSMGDMSIYFGMLDSIVARDLADLPAAYCIRQQV